MSETVKEATRDNPYLLTIGDTTVKVWNRTNNRITVKNPQTGSFWAKGDGSSKMDIPAQIVRASVLSGLDENDAFVSVEANVAPEFSA
jgi:hypothetical protein